jgi:hypothetical protein
MVARKDREGKNYNKCVKRINLLAQFVHSLRSSCTNSAKPFGHRFTAYANVGMTLRAK